MGARVVQTESFAVADRGEVGRNPVVAESEKQVAALFDQNVAAVGNLSAAERTGGAAGVRAAGG
jgi:hypothetical protein